MKKYLLLLFLALATLKTTWAMTQSEINEEFFDQQIVEIAENHGLNETEIYELSSFVKNFFLYPGMGIVAENLFTMVQTIPLLNLSESQGSWKLEGYTQAWVIPLYILGFIAVEHVTPRLREIKIYGKKIFDSPILRGAFYTCLFYTLEYIGGQIAMQLTGEPCPWEYKGQTAFAGGILNGLHAPVWALAGLTAELAVKFIKNLRIRK